MSLLFLDTHHGYSTGGGTLRVQAATLGYEAINWADDGGTGRFAGTTYWHVLTTSCNFASKNFSMTGTVLRFAVDNLFPSAGKDAFIAAINNATRSQNIAISTLINSTACFFGLVRAAATGKIELRKGASVLASSTNTFTNTSNYYHIEVEADIKVAGTFKMWVNNTLEINYSGDLVGSTTGSPVNFCDLGGDTRRSLLAIWDDEGAAGFSGSLGDFRPVQLLPNGVGSSSQSTVTGAPTRHEAVDDAFRNGTTDYITLSNNGDKDLYAYSDVGITGPVIAVVARPSASLGGAGTAKVKAQCKSGSATAESSESGALGTISGSYGGISLTHEFKVDPNTGVAWTVAGVDAAEFGVSAVI